MNDSTNNKANSVVAARLIFAAGAACENLGRDGDRALNSSQQQHLLETKALAMGDELFNWHKAWSMESAFELNSYICNWHIQGVAA